MSKDSLLSMRWTLALGTLVITFITVIVTVMFLRQGAIVYRAKVWILHSHEVAERIEALSSKIKDSVSYERGYLMSGDPSFLTSYYALTRVPQNFSDLPSLESMGSSIAEDIAYINKLISDNAKQKASIDAIEQATNDLVDFTQQRNMETLTEETNALIAFMDATIRQAIHHDPAALSLENIKRSKAMLDEIRSITTTMLAEETRLIDARTHIDQEATQRNTILILSAIAFFYISKLLLTHLAYRQWRQAKTMENMHRVHAQEVVTINDKLQIANQDMAELNRKIKESGQAQLRAVVDHALDGLITINAKGIVESFNPACVRIFGYQVDEVVGQNIKMLMPEPYYSAHDGFLERYHETRKASIIGTAGREVVAKRKDGSIFPMDLSISSFVLDGEEYFSGTVRDITLRKKAEAELLRYTKELEHSNQELDDFAYIASHDLKEPLRGLFNHASFLLEDYADRLDEEGVRRLNRLSQLAQRMEHLVNDLLYFSRLGRSDLAIQMIDPNQIIHDIEQMMESFLKERHARLVVPSQMPFMKCDKPRITEVFRNLITNAAKYNDKPDPVVEVGFLTTANAPHGVEKNVFYVKDNGIGIEPEFHQEIFRIFKRLNKDEGNERGTGVGLTFVKKIVERHHGHIWLDSKPGLGTTFYFNLSPEGEQYG